MTGFFQNFGLPELIIILVIALLLFGPSKLPELGKAFGKAIKSFRDVQHDVEKDVVDAGSDESDKASRSKEASGETKKPE